MKTPGCRSSHRAGPRRHRRRIAVVPWARKMEASGCESIVYGRAPAGSIGCHPVGGTGEDDSRGVVAPGRQVGARDDRAPCGAGRPRGALWLTRGGMTEALGRLPYEEVARLRTEHGEEAARILGAEPRFMEFRDTRVEATVDAAYGGARRRRGEAGCGADLGRRVGSGSASPGPPGHGQDRPRRRDPRPHRRRRGAARAAPGAGTGLHASRCALPPPGSRRRRDAGGGQDLRAGPFYAERISCPTPTGCAGASPMQARSGASRPPKSSTRGRRRAGSERR